MRQWFKRKQFGKSYVRKGMLQTDPEEESVRRPSKYSRKVTQTGEGRAAARHLTGRGQ